MFMSLLQRVLDPLNTENVDPLTKSSADRNGLREGVS